LSPSAPAEVLPSSVVQPDDGTDNLDDFLFYTTGAPEEGEVTANITASAQPVSLPPAAFETVLLPQPQPQQPEGRAITGPARIQAATAPAAPAPAAPEEEGPIVAGSYFINKLKELDRTLFVYKKTDKSVKHYSSGCQANEDRQPVALTDSNIDVCAMNIKRMKIMVNYFSENIL
jgi:hypothetical protein